MKKTVLFLMNGFGIEKKESVSIYSPTLMPNMDKLTFEYIFASLPVDTFDFKDGYKTFSVGTKPSTVYTVVDNAIQNNTLQSNEVLKNHMNADTDGKLHLFVPIENAKMLEYIEHFLRYFMGSTTKEIWVHPVLIGSTIHQYKYLDVILNKIRSICDDYSRSKIGVVVGKNYLFGEKNIPSVKKLYRIFVNEVGEKWPDTTNKLETLYQAGINPDDVAPFVVKNGFKLNDNDAFLIMNYEVVDCHAFTDLFTPAVIETYAQVYKNIKISSLFPVKTGGNIPSLFAYAESKISVASHVEKMGAKTLVITTRDRMKPINYYLNGLRNVQSKFIQFAVFDENNLYNDTAFALLEALLKLEYDFFIIDYDIASASSIEELKEILKGMDTILGKVHMLCKKEQYSLFISSLYGLKKTFTKEDQAMLVDFSAKVPVIVADKAYPKNIYHLEYGNIYELALTLYKNIKEETDFPTLLKGQKKGFSLFHLFKKR